MQRPFIFTSLGVVRGESKRGNRKCGPENYLVANPEDRFSRDVAHFRMVYQFIAVHQSYTIYTS